MRLDDNQKLEPYFNVNLDAKDLDLASLREDFARQADKDMVQGKADLQLHVAGAPSEEIDFQFNLSSESIALRPNTDYTHPITLKKLSGHGSTAAVKTSSPASTTLPYRSMNPAWPGKIKWLPKSKPFSATLTILDSDLPVNAIKRWLP